MHISSMKVLVIYSVILAWFVSFSPLSCRGEGGCSEKQRKALLEIRNFTLSNWDGNDCCEFDGVVCYDGIVEDINLQRKEKSMSRTWYPNVTSFTLFDGLYNLGMSDMQIGGDLRAFCELRKLKDLTVLDLSKNLLEGSIPPCFGTMQNLRELDLSGNRLCGNIPPSLFSNQSHMYRFNVAGNQLEGLLSFSIFANSSLSYLDLSNNYELKIETESPSWVPKFSLDILGLANCNLNEKANHVVPSFISTQYDLEWLDLSHNSLKGSIPCWLLFSQRITTLLLRGNRFDSSSFDCTENGTSPLQALDISSNQIKGTLPEKIGNILPNLEHVNMSSNELEGTIPRSLSKMNLEILELSNNMFSGRIPHGLTGTGSRLVYLNLSNNKLRGEMLPRTSNMTQLECLQLSGNHFEGILSPAISRSPSLVILDVRNNNLSGNLPKWLYEHPHLVAVLLGGNHFDGRLQRLLCRMTTLQVLDISNNHLSGGIPSCLDNITFWKNSSPSDPNDANYFTKNGRLQYLLNPMEPDTDFDIGTNFLTKNVLYTFTGVPLSLMTGIDLSLNQLTGNIPSQVGELSQLRSLNLSNNILTGSIPTSFRNMKSLESLDLSHNKLSGEIPREMVEVTSIAVFCVAYNNLSGRIPLENQFSTFDVQCFDGNPFLCGEMLPQKCSTTKSAEPGPKGGQEEGSSIIDNNLFFYAFIAVSYAFGFWVFFGILIYNKSWRQKYFRVVDRHIFSFLELLSEYGCY